MSLKTYATRCRLICSDKTHVLTTTYFLTMPSLEYIETLYSHNSNFSITSTLISIIIEVRSQDH